MNAGNQKPPDDREARFTALLRAIRGWDGTAAAAAVLRGQANELRGFQGKRENPAEQELMGVLSQYAKSRRNNIRKVPEGGFKDPAVMGPFLGDPALGKWPWHEPRRIDDDEARAWLPVVGQYAPADDEKVLAFVLTMFRLRPRKTWVPTSYALARLASRLPDGPAAAFLEQGWREVYPDGLRADSRGRLVLGGTTTTPKGTRPADAEQSGIEEAGGDSEGAAHRVRHVLHAACAWLAGGARPGRLPGLAVDRLSTLSLPVDNSDASAVLLAYRALLGGAATRAEVVRHLPARMGEVQPNEQAEAVLREALAPDLAGDTAAEPALAAVVGRLRQPRWKEVEGYRRVDALQSWLDAATWFRDRRDQEAVEAMRRDAGEAREAFALAVDGVTPGGVGDPVEAVLPRLGMVWRHELWATTCEPERTARVVELLRLLADPRVAQMSWKYLLARACGEQEGRPFPEALSVSAAAAAHLALRLATRVGQGRRGQSPVPPTLIRDLKLTRPVVLGIAASADERISPHVAIEIERELRRAKSGEDQVKFLWEVLRRDPPTRTFRQLRMVLRTGEDELRDVVAAIEKLDELREKELAARKSEENRKVEEAKGEAPQERDQPEGPKPPSPAEIAGAFDKLATVIEVFLRPTQRGPGAMPDPQPDARRDPNGKAARPATASEGDLPRRVRSLAQAMENAGRRLGTAEVGSEDWLRCLRELLLGDGEGGEAVWGWAKWLGRPLNDQPPAWKLFEEAALALRRAGKAVSGHLCREFAEALGRLRRSLGGQAPAAAGNGSGSVETTGGEGPALAWPEVVLVDRALGAAATWLSDRLEAARRCEQAVENLEAALGDGNEAAAVEMAAGADVDLLPPDQLRRLGRFLLDHLMFREAHDLRQRVRAPGVLIPAVWAHLTPLLVGVAAGVFFVLDVGTVWNEVLLRGHAPAYWATLGLSLLLSFVLLAGSIASRMPSAAPGEGEWLRRGRRIVRRVLPVWLLSLLLALAVSAATLWILGGTTARAVVDLCEDKFALPFAEQMVLWGCLGLFLGTFLGLILQGRAVARDE